MPVKKQPSKGTTKGNIFGEVAKHRLKDFDVLLAGHRWDAAVYLAWYVIECRLKYALTARQGITSLPKEYETHQLKTLLDVLGIKADDKKTGHLFAGVSSLMDDWDPDMRYRYRVNKFDKNKAHKFCKQVQDVYEWLIDFEP